MTPLSYHSSNLSLIALETMRLLVQITLRPLICINCISYIPFKWAFINVLDATMKAAVSESEAKTFRCE